MVSNISYLQLSLQSFWQWLFGFIPNLLGALIVFIIGLIVASIIEKIVKEVLLRVGFNKIFDKTGWDDAFTKADLKLNPAEFIGKIIKLTLIIIFLMPAAEMVGLPEFAIFLKGVINYIPHVLVAAFMVAVASLFADVLSKIAIASVEKVGEGYSVLAGTVVKWAIWFFAILAILNELQIFRELVNTIFTGLVAVLVLAFGLSFGLGGKDVASELLKDLRDKLRRK
jgi:hypothetical protein